MTRTIVIAKRLREVLLNGCWIVNTNYKQSLSTITWKQATQKIESVNTIAALTYHINYYLAGLINVFDEGKLEISDKFSFDLAPIKSKIDWQNLVEEFLQNATRFVNIVEKS